MLDYCFEPSNLWNITIYFSSPSMRPSELFLMTACSQKSLPAEISNGVVGCPPRNQVLSRGAWFQALLCQLQVQAVFSSPWAECGHCDSPLFEHVPAFRCCRITPGSGPSHKILIPFGMALCGSCYATHVLRGCSLKWVMLPVLR